MMELSRRCRSLNKRIIEIKNTKRAFLTVTIICGLLFYIGPSVFRWLRQKTPIMIDPNVGCVSQYVDPLYRESLKFQASVLKSYEEDSTSFLPYIGNGKLGLPLDKDDQAIYIFHKRSLIVPLPIFPIVTVELPGAKSQEAIGVHYTSGLAYKFKCFNQRRFTVELRQELFAYRLIPSIIVQNIRIKNPLNEAITVMLKQKGIGNVSTLIRGSFKAKDNNEFKLYSFKSGSPDGKNDIIVSVALFNIPDSLTIDAKSVKQIQVLTAIHYDKSGVNFKETAKNLEMKVKDDLKLALATSSSLKTNHIQIWQQLWTTGFGISESKVKGAVNGDRINATIYYVLSNSRSYLSELNIPQVLKDKLLSMLAYPESCYNGLYTLQASTLWGHLTTIDDVNKVVALWMLTLEKQGCQELTKTGAEGVIQAMTLSFGGLRFTNHHLEFLSNPGDLHRDYFFRRISYGNTTRLNITVIVGVDNKAVLQVSVDRSDNEHVYWACDAGCLDPPVKLSSKLIQFPVKKTEPITAVLYITSDKEHMEELKHTIHVKEVQEAPAHEHHVIALHRHGHQLGGLPALFWVSIAFLIVVFHLFLAKLVYNEYCSGGEKARGRYIV